MEDLVIKASSKSPHVIFRSNGELLLEGQAVSENANEDFDRILKWCFSCTSDTVNLTLKLEYINSASIKKILETIKCLYLNPQILDLGVIWYVDKDDEDLIETSGMYAELFPTLNFEQVIS